MKEDLDSSFPSAADFDLETLLLTWKQDMPIVRMSMCVVQVRESVQFNSWVDIWGFLFGLFLTELSDC